MDEWDNLTDHEAAALERAEEKYRALGVQTSPFAGLSVIAAATIFRVNFTAYRLPAQGETPGAIEFHADRARLRSLCELGKRVWLPEIDRLAELLLRADTLLRETGTIGDDLEWELQSFGLQWSADSVIAGYTETNPLVLNRKMFLEFFAFLASVDALDRPLAAAPRTIERLSHQALS